MDFLKFLLLYKPLYNNEKIFQLSSKNNKKSIQSLININSLEKLYEIDILDIIKSIYYNKNSIHQYLYENEEFINITSDSDEKLTKLSFLFYLSLLIADNINIVNYNYKFIYIKNIDEQQNQNQNKFNKVLLSKIILELINDYKGLDNTVNNYENELKKIETANEKIIKDNINIFNKLGLKWSDKDIKSKKIDEIYSDIIISLIKIIKLRDYEYIYNIIFQLDLESIDITKKMFDKINNFFENEDKEYNIIEYYISKNEDLYDNKKINFYYILLKYILKNSIFIYQINFLLITRKFLIKLIKSKTFDIEKLYENNTNKRKIEFIIKTIIDSDYFMYKYIKLKDKKNELNDDQENNEDNKINNDEVNNFNKEQKDDEIDRKIKKIEYKNILTTSSPNNGTIHSNNNSQINSSNNNDAINLLKQNIFPLKTDNNENNENNEEYLDINPSSSIPNRIQTEKKEKYYILEYSKNLPFFNNTINQKETHTVDFIKQLDEYFVFGGTRNTLKVYDKDLKKIAYIGLKEQVNNILEYNENKNNKFLNILVCCKNNIYLYSLNIENKNYQEPQTHKSLNSLFLFSADNNYYINCCKNKVIKLNKLFIKNEKILEIEIIKNETMKSVIKIKDNIIVFKSNKIISKGKNKLTFLNFKSNAKIKTNPEIKEEYSFVFTNGGLLVLPSDNEELNYKDKVLLCACKKYFKNQKNGILLINIKLDEKIINDNSININYFFYDTGNFEVYCFCPINEIIKSKNILTQNNRMKSIDYFLVGGFEKSKCKGMIKIYKIHYGKIYENTKIEFIQDVDFNKNNIFKGFKGPVISIAQSSFHDNIILVSCWDENESIYSFKKLNIEYYLNMTN